MNINLHNVVRIVECRASQLSTGVYTKSIFLFDEKGNRVEITTFAGKRLKIEKSRKINMI